MAKLNEAILAVQGEIKALSKDKENPFYKSMYLDINQIIAELKPLLVKNGLVVTQPLTHIAGKPAIALIVAKDDEAREYYMPLPELTKPQEMGSCITYYRRYALQSYFLLESEDDDANLTNSDSKVVKKKFNYPSKVQSNDRNSDF